MELLALMDPDVFWNTFYHVFRPWGEGAALFSTCPLTELLSGKRAKP